jgi:Xaa-Pro aminopeptidase
MWGMSTPNQDETPVTPASMYAQRLAGLRALMKQNGLDGYLVPHSDEFMNEYLPPGNERLAWLTGFTGSHGMALVLEKQALVLTGKIYGIQVKKQVDRKYYTTSDQWLGGPGPWLEKIDARNLVIGFDPQIQSILEIKNFRGQFEPRAIELRPVDGNLIDQLWSDRPPGPHTGVEPFLEAYAGRSSTDKRILIGEILQKRGVAAAFLADPTDVAWLLNIRARDLAYTPLALSRVILFADGTVDWIIDPLRVSLEIRRALGNAVAITPPENIAESFMRLKAKVGKDKVLVDEHKTTYSLARLLEDRNIHLELGQSPVIIPRACKADAEQKSIRDAHRKDALALIRFMAWFADVVPRGQLDELGVVDKLESFRKMDPAYRGPSFETVAGFGPNGAIMHYRPTNASNRPLRGDSLLLLDSGGQYVGGTTDITRVLPVGEPTDAMIRHYTTVLKAHCAVARATFPVGTMGAFFDALSRAPLWAAGMDYGHRLGHGVGCFGAVHEPSADLSPKSRDEVRAGMLLSNEPGFYLEDHYGIRLENLMLVVPEPDKRVDNREVLGFETVSLVPFDPGLTHMTMLTHEERAWLSAYHTQIINEIGPLLVGSERAWLETVCAYFI